MDFTPASVDDVKYEWNPEAVVTAKVLHQVLMNLEEFTTNTYDFALLDSPYEVAGGRPITARALKKILSNQQGIDYIDARSVTVQHLHSHGIDVVEELLSTQEELKRVQTELSELRSEVLALRKELALGQKLPSDLAKLTLEY
jgi:hypothetical protein